MTDLDTPYRLPDILPIAYPNGGMTLTGLRREIARGNLVVEKTAGKFFVTMRAINEMRERCRVKPSGLTSGTGTRATRRTASSSRPGSGTSSTGESMSAQDALRMKKQRQIASSRNTN
jgi:hypothetical protein